MYGVELCFGDVDVAFMFATLRNRLQQADECEEKALPLGQAFGDDLGWEHEVSDSCGIAQKRNVFKCEGRFC